MQVDLVAPDDTTLYALFAAERAAALAMDTWDPALKTLVLRQQFDARRRGYQARHPDAVESLITADGAPVGWTMFDRTTPAWRLVDIGVAAGWRKRGIATRIIRGWQDEARAAGRGIGLSVARDNAVARSLYERLGFRAVAEGDVYIEMEWQA